MTPNPLLDSGYPHPRRGFLKVAAALTATLPARLSTGSAPAPTPPPPQPPRVDGQRLNAILGVFHQFGGTDDGGTTRLAYSAEDIEGRLYAAQAMRQSGLEVSVDVAGNLIGRRPGTDPEASRSSSAPIWTPSPRAGATTDRWARPGPSKSP